MKITDICIAAHHDDIEIMAYAPISACYSSDKKNFAGVVVTDGGGSPRSGRYENFSDEEMKAIRVIEQKNAASIGRYAEIIFLSHKSADVKNSKNREVVEDIKKIILNHAPKNLYTHNLADKHDTHVAVAMHVIRALRELPFEVRPEKIISMEVWRSLDWLCDEDKIVCDTSAYPNISTALLSVFDSQISGGKRYDLAAQGRRVANATFFASHDTDRLTSASFGLDITALVNSDASPTDFIATYINKFKEDVINRAEAFWH
jgi:LmbE family N-acetylglucosaminyl deacetylase